MSFSISTTGTKDEVRKVIREDANTPEELKTFLHGSVMAFSDDARISVSCYGHKRGVYNGDTNPSTATIEVKEAK